MPLSPDALAPYAPPGSVIEVLRRYRERGLTKPFTTDVLERAGVPASLSRRTLQALKLLGFIDAEGIPNPEFEEASRAPEEQYKERIGELITATEIAERAIGGLKHTVRDVNENLGNQLPSASCVRRR